MARSTASVVPGIPLALLGARRRLMNRSVWIAAALACAASAVMTAAPADRGITVTGCGENFSSTDVSGTTERGFLLADVKPVVDPLDPAAASGQTPTPGTPVGTSGVAAAGRRECGPEAGLADSRTAGAPSGTAARLPREKTAYRLESGDQDLKDHVGHKVEIS